VKLEIQTASPLERAINLDEVLTKMDNSLRIRRRPGESDRRRHLMKSFALLPLFGMVIFLAPNLQTPTPDGSPISVLSFKWARTHQTIDTSAPDKPLPARAMTPSDKAYERSARINDPAGKRDPNADTVDARGAALEQSVRDAEKGGPKTVGTFAYQAKIHNSSKQVVEVVFWEYQFTDSSNPNNVTRRQFLCGINLKPDKDKDLQAYSLGGPTTVNAETAANSPFQEKVVINRVEFADGKSWMRKDWNANEIKAGYQRAMATPWSPGEMCRAL
jgi:hypothetical protein